MQTQNLAAAKAPKAAPQAKPVVLAEVKAAKQKQKKTKAA